MFVLRRSVRRAAAALVLSAAALAAARVPVPAADLPNCFVAPPPAALFSSPAPAPQSLSSSLACTLLYTVVESSDESTLAFLPGALLNKQLGVATDAFPDAAYAVRFTVTPQFNAAFSGPDALVRFSNSAFSAQIGSWWTVTESVSDAGGKLLGPSALAAKLALPPASIPNVEATATQVRVGTVGFFGLVAPAFGQPGGGVQFWFPSEPVFSTAKPL